MAFSYGMGKGLREPCYPFRQANVFGAALNDYKANNWNCLPQIIGETRTFDVSGISKGHEIGIALVNITNTSGGNNTVTWDWYRNRDNALIRSAPWSFYSYSGGWFYIHCGTAWVDWEINENGDYRVEVTITGAINYYKVIQFTVTGIPEEIPEPEEPEGFFATIVGAFNTATSLFYSLYTETLGWSWLPSAVPNLFLSISQRFNDLAWGFSSFGTTWYELTDELLHVLTWENIKTSVLSWIPNLESISTWFSDWWGNITWVVNSWWSGKMGVVMSWIDAAKDWTKIWINYLDDRIDELRVDIDNISFEFPDVSALLSWFTNWQGNILALLNTWWFGKVTEIDALVVSTIKARFPFYNDLVVLWGDIKSFFTDPEDWLYKSVDRIVERFW